MPRPYPCSRKSTSATSCPLRIITLSRVLEVEVANPLHTFVATSWSPFRAALVLERRSRKLRLGEVGAVGTVGTRDDDSSKSEKSKNRFPHDWNGDLNLKSNYIS